MEKQKIVQEIQKIIEGSNDFIILEFDGKKNYYIQFSIKSETVIIGEAVSNYYLGEGNKLKPLQIQKLKEMKWFQNFDSDNFSREFTVLSENDYEPIADMVLQIISEVYLVKEFVITYKI